MRTSMNILLALFLATTAGCHVNRARAVKETDAVTRTSIEEISIMGSYSITEDGTVAYTPTPRPDGDLLGRESMEAIGLGNIDGWIRTTTSRAGGTIARITSITGPYREDPEDPEDPLLYDITIETWVGR